MMKKLIFFVMFAMALTACDDNDGKKTIPSVAPDAAGTFTDTRDDNEYGWVRYGGLDWMDANLRYLTETGSCSIYHTLANFEGEETSADRLLPEYGYLYDYMAAETACPDGWRLPSDEDWQKLENALGMGAGELPERGMRGDYQGFLMQDSGSGLNMKAGGFYSKYGVGAPPNHFRFFGIYGYFWTSTLDVEGFRFYRMVAYTSDRVERESTMVDNRLSIRCVRNAQ